MSENTLDLQDGKPEEEKGSFKQDLYYWTQALVVALVALVFLTSLVGRLVLVDGSSMVPTLHNGDMLVLRSIGYTPKQGDVVVLRKPGFPPSGTAPIVKRVIATEGQHVRIDYDEGKVYVDGVALDEPYINGRMALPNDSSLTVLDVVVPEGSIYVLGDNRNNSSDSRHQRLGTVDTRYVLGQVLWVFFPFSDFGSVS